MKKEDLTPEEFHITQEKGTEAPFSGEYLNNKEKGLYHCLVCGEPLFSSETKYDSHSGWPSFFSPFSKEAVEEKEDLSHGLKRVEVVCKNCGAHLGHLFPDGPKPSGCRYCINSKSLKFKKKKDEE